MKKRFLLVMMVLLVLGGLNGQPVSAAPTDQAVTLYVHGHRGGKRSMKKLINQAHFQKGASRGVVALVSRSGHVQLRGHWPAHGQRRIVQVIFRNHNTTNYARLGWWLHNVLVALQQRDHIRQFNVVAHSLGNAAVMDYELQYSRDQRLPKLKKYVAIAGNFDGIPGVHRGQHPNHTLKDGWPSWIAPEFRAALARRNRLDLQGAQILNIYGTTTDRDQSDGKVLNASSRALAVLMAAKSQRYEEKQVWGRNAQHSKLRTNRYVGQMVDRFLW